MGWILIAELLIGIYFIWRNRVFWKTWSKKLIIILASLSILEVTFAACLTLMLPRSIALENGALLNEVDILGALRAGLKVTFSTLGGDSGDLMDLVDQSEAQVTAGMGTAYWILGEAFALAMPLLAAANIIVLVGSFHKIIKIGFYGLPVSIGRFGAKEIYVFSCLSRESVQLASYLAPKKGKNAAIFLRSKPDLPEDADSELHSILKNVKGILFPGGEEQLEKTSFLLLWRKIKAFYFISDNADENFLLAEELLEILNKKNVDPKEIFVFSEHPSGPRLIDRLREGLDADQHRLVHLINPSRAMVYYLLSRYPLMIPAPDQNKILFLGLGNFGSEFLRAALAFTVMDPNKKAVFYIYDREAKKRYSTFKLSAPEACANNEFRLAQGEALSAEFFQELEKLAKGLFCVVISLGEDEVNLQVAIHLVILIRRLHWETAADRGKEGQKQECPVRIFVHIHDHGKKMALINWCQQQKAWQPKVYVFGALEDAYSPDVLMPRRMWEQARKLHCDLKTVGISKQAQSDRSSDKEKNMCLSEYERRSSLACVAHLNYYLLDAMNAMHRKEAFYTVSDGKDSAKNKCPEDRRERCRVYSYAIEDFKNQCGDASGRIEELARQEHLRWMNYVRSEGFCLAKDKIRLIYKSVLGTHLDKDALLSPCLIPFDDLSKIEKEVGIGFREKDRAIIENIEKYTHGLWSCEKDSARNNAVKR